MLPNSSFYHILWEMIALNPFDMFGQIASTLKFES